MKKVDVAQALSVVANFGVIVGIAFLAYEIRQNTIAISGTTVQALAEQSQQDVLLDLEPDLVLPAARDALPVR